MLFTLDAEVAVVGAGPVGSSLALMLGRAGIKTVLLDGARFPRDKPCGEGLMPAGARVLEGLGVDLRRHPPLHGVSYRLPGAGTVDGHFQPPALGRGVRRLCFDETLAASAAGTANVEARFGCAATGLEAHAEGVRLETAQGQIRAAAVVGADGRRSRVAAWMGWWRPPHRPYRYALAGHLHAPGHGCERIIVTLLTACEVYLAPTGADELLVAVLGAKPALKEAGEHVREAYMRRVAEAHPELAGCRAGTIRGAGPFATRPAAVAGGRVFLAGDAAGFLDPLTGDGISAGLLGAEKLAALLQRSPDGAAEAYRSWERRQWWTRLLMSRLALTLSGSTRLARRALSGLSRRPSALDRLLEVNDGSRSPLSLSPLDWAALGGL